MKRWIPFGAIIILCFAAIIVVLREKVDTRPSSQAVLTVAGEAERELSRIPANLDRMSDEDEVRIGDELTRSYEAGWRHEDQTAETVQRTQAYVGSIGATVAAHACRKLSYRFHYISDQSFVNAFALPGGHVFVGEGLIKLMQSEDALAAVLGHEVEHIDLRHCAERVQTEGRLRSLGTIGDLLSIPVGVFRAGYSSQQELEADKEGTTLAVASGYSPAGILQLLDEFERLENKFKHSAENSPPTPVDEAAKVSLETLQDYFRSHPPAAERKQEIQLLILSKRWPAPRLRPLGA